MKKEITSGLNKYLANTAILYIKWHNLHWNVVGRQFKSIHEYLETLYDALADILDETAELLKINDETPLASMKEYLEVATIKEIPSKELSVEDTLEIVAKDMTQMCELATELRKIADEEDNFDVVGMLESHISNYTKNLWFLKAMGK